MPVKGIGVCESRTVYKIRSWGNYCFILSKLKAKKKTQKPTNDYLFQISRPGNAHWKFYCFSLY